METATPQPPATTETVETLVGQVFGRSPEEQAELLASFAPMVLARLDPVERDECERALCAIPPGQAPMDPPRHPVAAGPKREVLLGRLVRQPVGAQLHVLQLLASRVLGHLGPEERERIQAEMFARAEEAGPTVH